MDSDALASMYAQILNGVPKEQSRYVTDEESGALWDAIESEIEEIRSRDPAAQFSVPNEVPDGPDDTGGGETPDSTAPADQPADQPAAPPADQPVDQPPEETP